MVLDKPAGLRSHAGPRGGPSVEDIFPTLSRRRDGPWLAHRLDTDTAGCLLIALRRAALLAAQAAFATGRVRKTYWAIVEGGPAGLHGVIDAPLRKISTQAGWRMVSDEAGQKALTEWAVRGSGNGMTGWSCIPNRANPSGPGALRAARMSVLGDPIYGAAAGRLHLLARALSLPLDPPVSAEAPVPEHMRAAWLACRGD